MQGKKVSLAQSALIGLAGNAPSYSIAVTSGALIGAAAGLAPALIFYCGFIVLGILLAYKRLNEEQASAGAAYAWVSKIINPTLGFFAGWCLLVASVLFIVSASLGAGKAAAMAFDPTAGENKVLVTVLAFLLLAMISFAVVRGTEVVGRLQSILTALEIVLIVVIGAAIVWKVGANVFNAEHARGFMLRGLTMKSFADGIVIAIFFYWGWDVIFNMSEETVDGHKTAGRAGLIVLLGLIVIFTFYAAAAASMLTEEEIAKNAGNAIFAFASKIFAHPWDYLALLAFFVSAIGAMEASLLQFSRTVFAKARDGRVSKRFAQVHPRWDTPAAAVLLDFAIVAVILFGSLVFSGVEEAISAGIGATGIMVAYYYGFAGIACVVYFVREGVPSLTDRVLYIVWPSISVLVLVVAAVLSTFQYSMLASSSVIASLLLGAIVLYLYRHGHASAMH